MELRDYWQIVWSRRMMIGVLLLITFVASMVLTYGRPINYETVMRILIKPILPSLPDTGYYSREYYRTLFAEYIQDDLSEVIKSRQFATDIKEVIQRRHGEDVRLADIADAFTTQKEHRVVRITIITARLDHTTWIGEAAEELLRTVGWQYVSPGDRRQVDVEVIDPPQDPEAPTLLRRLLTVVLHVSVALGVGLSLAFLLETFDDRIQSPDEIEGDLGWDILAVVPSEKPIDLVPVET